MPKKTDTNRKHLVNNCLDEIDVCLDALENKRLSEEKQKSYEGWIRRQKLILKELGYKGKIRRRKRNSA